MEGLADLWVVARTTDSLLIWVLGSVLIYFLVINVLWLIKDRWRSPSLPWQVRIGRFVFFLVVPYLVLGGWPRGPYQGLLSLEDMGIVGLDERWPVTRWLEATGIGLGWGLVVLLILALALASANRHTEGLWLRFPSRPGWLILLDGIGLTVHWAFYRSALVLVLDDAYAGVFWGLGLVYLEWSLDPFWRRGWRIESQAAESWLGGACLCHCPVVLPHPQSVDLPDVVLVARVCLAISGS